VRFTRRPRPQEHNPKEGRFFGPNLAGKQDGESARIIGAGEGNRTLVFSLEGCCSTIELHPHMGKPIKTGFVPALIPALIQWVKYRPISAESASA
jgi:hypothetical protein